ncbi:MAG: glycosyltransferase, partial [Sedimenticolaceae bacterium]
MHILMLSDVYFPRINGVSTSIQTFAQAFLNVGCRVSLIAPEYPDEHSAEFEIIRIRSRRLPFDPEDRLMSLREIKRLAPTLKAREIDLLHIQTPFVAHYAGVYLRRALGVKTVVSYHTYFEAYFEKYLPWAPRGWLRSVARRYSRT